MVLSLAYAAG
jgi:hypothetical protein